MDISVSDNVSWLGDWIQYIGTEIGKAIWEIICAIFLFLFKWLLTQPIFWNAVILLVIALSITWLVYKKGKDILVTLFWLLVKILKYPFLIVVFFGSIYLLYPFVMRTEEGRMLFQKQINNVPVYFNATRDWIYNVTNTSK